MGLVYVPEAVLSAPISAGDLVPVLADWAPMGEGFHIYYSSRRPVPTALRLLADLVRELRPLGNDWAYCSPSAVEFEILKADIGRPTFN